MSFVVMALAGAAAQKASDVALAKAWTGFQESWRRRYGRDPKPADLAAVSSSRDEFPPELPSLIDQLFGTSPILRRLRMVSPVFRGAKILWIDDNPGNQVWERLALENLGATVLQATNSDAAASMLRGTSFDLVLSDIARNDPEEGVRFAQEARLAERTPLVFYVGKLRAAPPPAGAFGITNRTVELFHLICDVLERRRS